MRSAFLLLLAALAAPASAVVLARPVMPRAPLRATHVHKLRGGESAQMSAEMVIAKVCPSLGVVLSNALYFAPLPATLAAAKAGSLGDLNPLPSSLMVLATISWVCYGLSVSNPYIVASNVPGAIVALLSFVSFMPLMKGNSQLKAVQYTLVGGASAALLLWTKLILGGATSAARSSAVGMFATVICIILFASPLSTMKTVIAEKNAASILAPLTLCQVTNCLMWTVYGFIAAKDVFVWGPNGTGLILGLVQLALKLLYPTK